ncbi:MAG: hypothetical protein EA369_00280 [Bradymonadales bacterium]|nr:MAG: hypothetical protein EA369_00280 [Bradymonadales bacterium]
MKLLSVHLKCQVSLQPEEISGAFDCDTKVQPQGRRVDQGPLKRPFWAVLGGLGLALNLLLLEAGGIRLMFSRALVRRAVYQFTFFGLVLAGSPVLDPAFANRHADSSDEAKRAKRAKRDLPQAEMRFRNASIFTAPSKERAEAAREAMEKFVEMAEKAGYKLPGGSSLDLVDRAFLTHAYYLNSQDKPQKLADQPEVAVGARASVEEMNGMLEKMLTFNLTPADINDIEDEEFRKIIEEASNKMQSELDELKATSNRIADDWIEKIDAGNHVIVLRQTKRNPKALETLHFSEHEIAVVSEDKTRLLRFQIVQRDQLADRLKKNPPAEGESVRVIFQDSEDLLKSLPAVYPNFFATKAPRRTILAKADDKTILQRFQSHEAQRAGWKAALEASEDSSQTGAYLPAQKKMDIEEIFGLQEKC